MAIHAVVGGVQLALEEPSAVAVLQRAALDRLEIALPGEQLAGLAAPELFRLFDGLLVERLVLLDALTELLALYKSSVRGMVVCKAVVWPISADKGGATRQCVGTKE
jgi:hypothetical protein